MILEAVEQSPDDIRHDEQGHTTEQGRDENLVEQIDVIHHRVVLWAGLVMAQPGSREVGGGVRMAPAAGGQQVLFDHSAFRVVYRADIVYAVAIDTDRFVGLLVRGDCLEHLDRGAVEIRKVGVEHVGADAIFIHQLRIGVAFGANLG